MLAGNGSDMKIEQMQWTQATGWNPEISQNSAINANWVLVFGSTECLKNTQHITKIRQIYPNALISGCSTAGEIFDVTLSNNSLSVTAIHFEHTQLRTTHIKISNPEDSFHYGQKLAQAIPHKGLRHAFVLSDGLNMNGNELVSGLTKQFPSNVSITGGLSGDAGRFEETLVLWQDKAQPLCATLIGLYGKELKVGFSSLGNWGSFEPEHPDTHTNNSSLYEMDGKSALALYKSHLGRHTDYLPDTEGIESPVDWRTASDALTATKASTQITTEPIAELAILISCVKQKIILKQKIEKKITGIRKMLGPQPTFTGFYSYGEISPFSPNTTCEPHNQMMTITIFSEE